MEFLKQHLGEALYDEVADKLKDKSVKLADLSTGEYVAKKKFEDEQQKVKTLIGERDKLDESLQALQKLNPEEMQKQIDTLTQQRDSQKADFENQIAHIKKGTKIKDEIMKANPYDASDIMALIDLDKISVEGEELVGFSEQMDAIKESKTYLFVNEQAANTGGGGNPSNAKGYEGTMDAAIKSAIWGAHIQKET